ncbi:MAG: hypothetical protein AAF721_41370 [Myxococcota bacterium]
MSCADDASQTTGVNSIGGGSTSMNPDFDASTGSSSSISATMGNSMSADGTTAGPGGTGSSTDGGSGSGSGSTGTAYAYFDDYSDDRLTTKTESVELPESPTSLAVEFIWSAEPGWPAPADLVLARGTGDEPLVQVFTRDGEPFARSGLDVVPLVADEAYEVRVHWADAGTQVSIVGPEGSAVVQATVALSPAEGLSLITPYADISAAPVLIGGIIAN